MPSIPKASYIIPYRSSQDPLRYQNLLAVLHCLSHIDELEIILVEQSTQPSLSTSKIDCQQHVVILNDKPFNRSRCFNEGVRHAKSPIVILGDADIVMYSQEMQRCIEACNTSFDAVNPYGQVVDLTLAESAKFKDNLVFDDSWSKKEGRKDICFCGGIVLYRKQFYEQLGGFDERFEGWGGEDNGMSVKTQKSIEYNLLPGKVIHEYTNFTAYHLWHEKPAMTTYGHTSYDKNRRLSDEYYSFKKKDIENLIAEQERQFKQKEK